jgi:hypothetical protein
VRWWQVAGIVVGVVVAAGAVAALLHEDELARVRTAIADEIAKRER